MKAARMSFSRKIFRNHNQIRFPALPEPPKTKFQKKTTFRKNYASWGCGSIETKFCKITPPGGAGGPQRAPQHKISQNYVAWGVRGGPQDNILQKLRSLGGADPQKQNSAELRPLGVRGAPKGPPNKKIRKITSPGGSGGPQDKIPQNYVPWEGSGGPPRQNSAKLCPLGGSGEPRKASPRQHSTKLRPLGGSGGPPKGSPRQNSTKFVRARDRAGDSTGGPERAPKDKIPEVSGGTKSEVSRGTKSESFRGDQIRSFRGDQIRGFKGDQI